MPVVERFREVWGNNSQRRLNHEVGVYTGLFFLLFVSVSSHVLALGSDSGDDHRILIHLEIASQEFDRDFRLLLAENDPLEISFGETDRIGAAGQMSVTANLMRDAMILMSFEFKSDASGASAETRSFQMMVAEGEAASIVIGESETIQLEMGVIAEVESMEHSAIVDGDETQCGSSTLSTPCSYQECGGSWMNCCGQTACCNQGCGWFGQCQIP